MPITVMTPDAKGVHVRRRTFGWLHKRTRRFPLPSYGYRFYTINYDAKILYYSREESERSTSKSICFADILGVEPLLMQQEDEVELERIRRSSWKSARKQAQAKERAKESAGEGRFSFWNLCGSYLPRLGNNVQKCGFVLQTAAKRVEFVCTSHREVEDWIAAIQAAMSLCKDDNMKAHSSEVHSEQSTQSSKSCTESEPSDKSSELFEVEDDNMDLIAPSCKVPSSTIVKPGRCFTDGSSIVVSSPVESSELDLLIPALMRSRSVRGDSGSTDCTTRETAKRSFRFGSPPGNTSIRLRTRLLARSEGLLP